MAKLIDTTSVTIDVIDIENWFITEGDGDVPSPAQETDNPALLVDKSGDFHLSRPSRRAMGRHPEPDAEVHRLPEAPLGPLRLENRAPSRATRIEGVRRLKARRPRSQRDVQLRRRLARGADPGRPGGRAMLESARRPGRAAPVRGGDGPRSGSSRRGVDHVTLAPLQVPRKGRKR